MGSLERVAGVVTFDPMPKKPSNFSAEILWASVSAKFQDAVLANVWCGQCREAVAIVDYTVSDIRGDVLLEGRCAVCGGRVRRHVETSQRPPPES